MPGTTTRARRAGFAIPISLAKPVVAQLAARGRVERGWLGVTIQRLTPDLAKSLNLPESHGVLVADVVAGSPASQAGLRPGDVITTYDGRAIIRMDDLPRAVAETPVGREVPLTVVRSGKSLALTARIGRLAESEPQPAREASARPSLGLSAEP